MKNKRWSQEEINYVEEKWGNVSLDYIAKKLDRSRASIQLKARRQGLGDSRLCGDKISLNQFSKATGISVYTIKERWVNYGFKMSITKKGKFYIRKIDLNKFWEWAENNKILINFAKWEEGILGIEPAWVKEKRRADLMNPSKVDWNRKWTPKEDMLLEQLLKLYKYTYNELAEQFNRTESAVKRRIYDLAITYRPIPRDNHVKWTEEENKRMLELNSKGYSTATIAKILNKTQLSIGDRLKIVSA